MAHFADHVRGPTAKRSAPKPAAARPQPRRIRPSQQAALWDLLQRKAAERAAAPPARAAPARSGLPGRLKEGIEALSGLAMDDVRVHRDSPEPVKLGALAFTRGSNIHLGPSQERHLPHEAWHTVQQKQGRVRATAQMKGEAVNDDAGLESEADRMGAWAAQEAPARRVQAQSLGSSPPLACSSIQFRRIPSPASIDSELPPAEPGFSVTRAALARILARAWVELPMPDRISMAGATEFHWTTEEGLVKVLIGATRDQLIEFAADLRKIRPDTALGDPNLLETPPRTGTDDASNLQKLVAAADSKVYSKILPSGHEQDLRQVFGSGYVGVARRRYAEARKAGERFVRSNRVMSDRSGFSDEAAQGGYFQPAKRGSSAKINLLPSYIDDPERPDSIVMFIHESVHAGNAEIDDFGGYVTAPMFTRATEASKIRNAAHFEVVPRRILGLEYSFANEPFIPATASGTGTVAVRLTSLQEAMRQAGDKFLLAWTRGLDAYKDIVEVARSPRIWYSKPGTARRVLKWSRIEKLTIHERASQFPRTFIAGFAAVTDLDVALSEGLVRRIRTAGTWVPGEIEEAREFIKDNATAAEKAALDASPTGDRAAKERDLLIALVLRHRGFSLTGSPSDDWEVIEKLASA